MRFDELTTFPVHEAERETPTGLANALSLLIVPLCAGGAAFIGSGLLALAFHWPVDIPLAVSGAAVLFALVWWSSETKSLMYVYERITRTDMNRDGYIGQPPEVTHFSLPTAPNSWVFGELPYPPALVLDWCRSAANGQSLAYTLWSPRFALPDGSQGDERYAGFRAWWAGRGYLREVGGNVGCRLTADGWPVVLSLAQMSEADGTSLLSADRPRLPPG